jgi:ketosteroid isomerase-like protein
MATQSAAAAPASNAAIARAAYRAYVTKDRAALEALLADDFHFTSPLDNRLDRDTYFRRCWAEQPGYRGVRRRPSRHRC